MRIAFLTQHNPFDRRTWSGTIYSMYSALQKFCPNIESLGPVIIKEKKLFLLIDKFMRKFLKKGYRYNHSVYLSKKYAKIFGKKLQKQSYDIIFAPSASTEIAFLETKLPIIYFSDATFYLMAGYQKRFSNLIKKSAKEGDLIESNAIRKASALIYPSDWAAKSAINNYGAAPSKVHVISMGPNLEGMPARESLFQDKQDSCCRLLFIGTKWEDKGGRIAYETLLRLEELNMDSELVVCGCKPPQDFSHKKMKIIPYLNKNSESEAHFLKQLYLNSNFLILPTRAECSAIVYCEAAAFGIPSITTDTGGVSSVVKPGINGYLLPLEARGEEYAKVIYDIFNNKERYRELRKTTRDEYEKRLNWDKWGKEIIELMNGHCCCPDKVSKRI